MWVEYLIHASRLPGRIDNQINNYWNAIKRKLLERSEDPYTHLPIIPYHGSFGFSMENHEWPKRHCNPSEVLIDFLSFFVMNFHGIFKTPKKHC